MPIICYLIAITRTPSALNWLDCLMVLHSITHKSHLKFLLKTFTLTEYLRGLMMVDMNIGQLNSVNMQDRQQENR